MVKITIICVILILMTMISIEVDAYENNHNCEKNPIYCQIIGNKPTIKKAYAFKLSNVIHKKTRKYNLDPVIFTAILAQESMYKVSAKNCTTGILETPESAAANHYVFNKCLTTADIGTEKFVKCVVAETAYGNKKVKVCTDFGVGQIWYKTANSYEFDLEKLTTDMDYSIEAAAIVLKDFKDRYSRKEQDWWTRYNARSRDARNKYKKLVGKFINAD